MTLTIERAFQFLWAEGSDATIRAALQSAGFTAAERETGWALVRRLASQSVASPAVEPNAAAEEAVRSARQALESEGAAFLRRAEAALRRLHPEAVDTLFGGLDALPDVALAVAAVIDRLASAEPAVLDTLQSRGLGADVQARLAEHVRSVASGLTAPEPGVPVAPQHDADLNALHAWFTDWAATARVCVTGRRQLIRLGLAKRRSPRAAASTTPSDAAPSQRVAA